MHKLQDKAAGLENDLAHLAAEMTRLAYTSHPVGSAARQYAKQEFRELEATYHTKVAQLARVGHSLVLASLTDQVGRAAAIMEGAKVHRCLGAAPRAAGGARFVEEVWVSLDRVPAFLDALDEIDGYVLGQRSSPYADRYPSSPIYYTVSVSTARDLYQLGLFEAACHEANKPEGGQRHG